MNYTQLIDAVQDYCVNDSTQFLDNMNIFIVSAEDRIFAAVMGPLYWKASSIASTVSATKDYSLVAGTIDVLGVRVCEVAASGIDSIGPSRYLLRKDIDFLKEAYPAKVSGAGGGLPKFYSVTSAGVSTADPTLTIRMAPVPDAAYEYEVEYYGKSVADSITSGATPSSPTTTVTWLSAAFPDVLLWGTVVQAYTFMKGDADIMSEYKSNFTAGLLMLKNMSESRQDTDTFGDQGAGVQQG